MIRNHMEVIETDMKADLVQLSVAIAAQAQKYFITDQDKARYIREECEGLFGPTWHCIVGESFIASFSYELEHFILLKYKKLFFMIFKCGYC
uniref:Dynein light chain n=1 Tax=Elaeophora elaphi TaxID=1147741 RepID=A0A0R3S0L6_9BILA